MTAKVAEIGGCSLTIYTSGSFMSPLMLFCTDSSRLDQIVVPMLDKLNSLGIPHHSLFHVPGGSQSTFPTAKFAVQNTIVGGRLLPRSLWDSPKTFESLNKGIRQLVDDGVGAYDLTVAPSLVGKPRPNNAVFPVRRTIQPQFVFFL
ncbi:hypothetical protein AN958_00070 [Leucoagaricus sp. SymC.cos]|nr:hypothetical protein AN958_00070 [Leucoagaricus sp. SymC.cos]